MLKYLIVIILLVALIFGSLYGYFSRSLFIDFRSNAEISTDFRAAGVSFVCSNGENILLRGVELTPSIPGHMAWDFAATVADYLRWFGQISEMGANSIYVSTTMGAAFYRALYEFNTAAENPLLVLHGIPGYNQATLMSPQAQLPQASLWSQQ